MYIAFCRSKEKAVGAYDKRPTAFLITLVRRWNRYLLDIMQFVSHAFFLGAQVELVVAIGGSF